MKPKKIKIGYFADGPWAHEAIKLLLADSSIEIKFIVPRFNTEDNTLREYAKTYAIQYILQKNVNEPVFLELIAGFSCDLFVSMSFNQIFRSPIINIPKLGIINCHAGKLPFYRGRNVLTWALINDEKEFGITVHKIDDSIDTGDIILQQTYPITDEDDYKTLLERAYKNCADLLYEAICLVRENNIKLIKQKDIHPVGLYCGHRKEGDEIINWNQTSRELFNFIRALCTPGPLSVTHLNHSIVKINKARIVPEAVSYKSIIGQIVGKSKDGFYVKTLDSILEIFDITCDEKIRIGDRFK